MARPDKAAAVAELTEKFQGSSGAVLTEYRGLTVKALKDLRRSLGDDATYAVSKNTLTTIAARQAGVPGVEPLLSGPTAIAFIEGDAVAVAKGLRDFARANPLLIIKGGVLDGKAMIGRRVPPAGRPGVPRGAPGQGRRCHAGCPAERRQPGRRPARPDGPPAGGPGAGRHRGPGAHRRGRRRLRRAPIRSPTPRRGRTRGRRPPQQPLHPRRTTPPRRRQLPLRTKTKEGLPPWRSSAPPSSSTRSRSSP